MPKQPEVIILSRHGVPEAEITKEEGHGGRGTEPAEFKKTF